MFHFDKKCCRVNNKMRIQEFLCFLIGFMCGYLIFQMLNIHPNHFKSESKKSDKKLIDLYETNLADKLFNEVKILWYEKKNMKKMFLTFFKLVGFLLILKVISQKFRL